MKDCAYAALRVVIGFMFLSHGYMKFKMGLETVGGYFGSAGVPASQLVAYIVVYGEIIGGILLILGLFTHWVSKLNIIIILGAIIFVHAKAGYSAMNGGYEYPLLILAACVVILTHGPGKYSLDARRTKQTVM